MTSDIIPNLNIVQTYDKFYRDALIHYESLDNLATFFGRAMHLHRHDRYYQIHFIHHGNVHLTIGDQEYIEQAPLIFFTPPPVPHGFVTEPDSTGQVLTIHQSIVEQLLQTLNYADPEATCITLKDIPKGLTGFQKAFIQAFLGVQQESQAVANFGQSAALLNWSQLLLIQLFRLISGTTHVSPTKHNQSHIFRQYLSLIEAYYSQHLPITDYAKLLNITEGQLNKICRAVTNSSSKRLIYERIILEAKYLLSYTILSIQQIAFELGFQDPAYFTRFFIKHTAVPPKQYREAKHSEAFDTL